MRNIRLLYLHSFLTEFFPHWPYQIIYLSRLAGSYTAAMEILALETLVSAVMDIPTGVLSDRIGRKNTIALGSLIMALGMSCYAMADGPGLLYAGALFAGLGQCLFSGNNYALLFETLKEDNREGRFAHYRSYIGSSYQMALCLSALVGIPLSEHGLRLVFIAAAVPQILAVPVALLIREPDVKLVERPRSFAILKQACLATWRNPKLMLLLAAKAITYGAVQVPGGVHRLGLAGMGGGAVSRHPSCGGVHRLRAGAADSWRRAAVPDFRFA